MRSQEMMLFGAIFFEEAPGCHSGALSSGALSAGVLFGMAYLLDLAIGDPRWLPHPVRLMGLAISKGETVLRRARNGKAGEFLRGMLLSIAVVGASGLGTLLLLDLTESFSKAISYALIVYLASTAMATRSLIDEVHALNGLLRTGELERARAQLRRVVGRDTDRLSESEIVRAGVETLAESALDGIVAPMFYLALGGVPCALAYKAINTLDSMIGYDNARYRYFGKFAARLDDVVNFVPARLTATLIVVAALLSRKYAGGACRIWLRDGSKHASPNAGRAEAAMAGALGVRLGGLNHYDGEPHFGAHLGDAIEPLTVSTLKQALVIVGLVSILMFLLTSIWLIYLDGKLLR